MVFVDGDIFRLVDEEEVEEDEEVVVIVGCSVSGIGAASVETMFSVTECVASAVSVC